MEPVVRDADSTSMESIASKAAEHDALVDAAEQRSVLFADEYGMVFDAILLSLGLTFDSTVAPIKRSAEYAACCDGSLEVEPEKLYGAFSMPFVLVKRLFPVAEHMRLIMSALESGTRLSNEQVTLYNHKVIQFMRCYASVARFCPKFYLSTLFEWLIAQCVELSALFQIVRDSGVDGGSHPQLVKAVDWSRGNVAFLLCFIRGSHFATLLAADYEAGLKAVEEPSQINESEVSSEALLGVLDGLKKQVERLEKQQDLYAQLATVAPDIDADEGFYQHTADIVRDTSWNTVNSLCTSVKRVPDLDLVVAPLFRVFCDANREMDLVHWAIDQDISEGIKDANLLFRQASTATRLLRTVFFSYEGTEYLKSVIYPSLRKMSKLKMSLELDPFRLPYDLEADQREELLKANVKQLLGFANEIMSAALKSVDGVPIQIRKFLLYARNTFMGAQKSRDQVDEEAATKLIVASLYFLRFLSPAVVTPHAYGVMDDAPSPELQRSLVLLGKVLQNAACGVEFDGTKEEFMSVCNSFVTQHKSTMMKLFNALIDAQGIGTRELKLREKALKVKKTASKRDLIRLTQSELEERVFMLRDSALLVNEFGLKASFLPMFRSGDGSEDAVRTIRSLVKLDVKIHEQRSSTRAEHVLSNALKNKSSPYSQVLLEVVADFSAYLPNDLVTLSDLQELDNLSAFTATSTMNLNYSDTSPNVGSLTHPLLLLDTITAHRPSRLASIARMLRASCQEVWEAGIALRDLSAGPATNRDVHEILDQDTPVVLDVDEQHFGGGSSSINSGEDAASFDESDSDTQSVAYKNQSSSGRSGGRKMLETIRARSASLSLSRGNSSSSGMSTPPPTLTVEGSHTKNSLAGLVNSTTSRSPQRSSSGFVSPFQSPATMRKRKAYKKRSAVGIGADETHLWAPALVLPQVLGLLHFLTVLRHTLKHARLENRVIAETPEVDSELANCVFEYSKLAKQAGTQLLALVIQDPTNPEVGNLGLAIANAGVLLTRAALELMNTDRQVIRKADRKEKPSSVAGKSNLAPSTRPRSKSKSSTKSTKKRAQKTQHATKIPLSGSPTSDSLVPSKNPLALECSPRGFGSDDEEDL